MGKLSYGDTEQFKGNHTRSMKEGRVSGIHFTVDITSSSLGSASQCSVLLIPAMPRNAQWACFHDIGRT